MEGKLPPKVLGLVIEWASISQQVLKANWELAQNLAALKKIPPLE